MGLLVLIITFNHISGISLLKKFLKVNTNIVCLIFPRKSQQSFFFPSLFQVNTADYNRYFYKCHSCMVGFKRRGMLVNHLANRHPEISPDSVPELSLPILKTRRNYYCQYCDKVRLIWLILFSKLLFFFHSPAFLNLLRIIFTESDEGGCYDFI